MTILNYFNRVLKFSILITVVYLISFYVKTFYKSFDANRIAYTEFAHPQNMMSSASHSNNSLSTYAKTVMGEDGKKRRFIILAMTDESFTEMAINLYESSFKRHKIHNYLFIGMGKQACITLNQLNIHCLYFIDEPNSNTSNIYGSKEFITKINLRTIMILQALHFDFSILHMDLDIVFLKNPLPEIEENLSKHDMMLLWDDSVFNAGFLSINPTVFSKHVYKKVQEKTNKRATLDDQQALNQVFDEMKKNYPYLNTKKVFRLDPKKFLCGKKYFEDEQSKFPSNRNTSSNCSDCLVVHNNWIVSKEAKIYRFKEALMWWVDKDNYYSHKERMYFSYDNHLYANISKHHKLFENEIDALKTAFAISQIINRTLILPRFNCIEGSTIKECSLLNHLSIRHLDKEFRNKYRENSFISNSLIPDDLKKFELFYRNRDSLEPLETPPIYTILTKHNLRFFNNLDNTNIIDFQQNNIIYDNEIKDKLGNNLNKIIHFTSLNGVKMYFTDKMVSRKFQKSIQEGFVRKDYRQF